MAARRGKSQARRNNDYGTPGWVWLVAGVAIAAVVFLAAACYGAWLMYDGLPIVMGIEKERAVMYGGALLTVALVILVSTRVGSVILWNLGLGPVFVSG